MLDQEKVEEEEEPEIDTVECKKELREQNIKKIYIYIFRRFINWRRKKIGAREDV